MSSIAELYQGFRGHFIGDVYSFVRRLGKNRQAFAITICFSEFTFVSIIQCNTCP